MPAITIATLRASGHKRLVYLSLMTGSVVLNASVSATPTFPASNLAITVNSGSASNVKRGMRVVVETSGGAYKGTLHVRAAGTISSANLPVREVSKGFVAVASTDVLKVYDDFPIADKLVAASETFAPDQETYVAQNADPAPIVSSGGAWAGWKADAAAIAFDGTNALNLDPDTADTITWANSTSGGTLSSAVTASPTLNLSATATGRYLVTRTATAVNTKSRTQYVAVRTHDSSDLPYLGVEESSMQADPLNGWTYSIRLFTDISSWPDMAPVVVWVDETINGTRQSLGAKASGRSHIKCAGYVRRTGSGWDEGEKRQYVTVEIMSPLAALGLLPGFSKVMTADATPDKWSEIKTLTVRRAIALLALSYTTLNESGHDLVFDDASMTTKLYPQLFLQKIDPLSQLRELALAVDCRVTCDRTGRVEVQHRLELLIDSSRAAVTETLALTTADLISYDLDREEVETVETFRTRGFVASATVAGATPLFAHWPGDAPGMGNQSDMQERLIADSASDNYQRCARYGAWANKVYVTAAGVKKRAPKMKVVLPGTYDCVDLYREFIGVTFTGNLRGVSPSDYKWLVESISTDWSQGTGRVTLDLVAATHGIIDETEADDTPPTDENSPFPPYTPVPVDPYPITPPPVGNWLMTGTQSLFAWNTDNFGYYCGPVLTGKGFDVPSQAGGPTWARVASGVSGNLIDAVQSAFTTTRDILLTDHTNGIYTAANVGASPTVTLRKTLNATVSGQSWRIIDASFGANYIVVVSHYINHATYPGTWITFSLDGGVTWSTETQLTALYRTGDPKVSVAGLHVSSRRPGTAITSAYTVSGSGASSEAKMYRLSNNFASATQDTYGPGDLLAYCIHVPWHNNDDESLVYFGRGNEATNPDNARTYRRDGTTILDISPTISLYKARPILNRSLHTCPVNRLRVAMAGTGGGTESAVFTATDGAATSASWTKRTSGTTTNYSGVELAGSNPDGLYLWGSSGVIGYSSDFGATIDDRRGNITTDFLSIGRFVRIRGL